MEMNLKKHGGAKSTRAEHVVHIVINADILLKEPLIKRWFTRYYDRQNYQRTVKAVGEYVAGAEQGFTVMYDIAHAEPRML